ncbi:hypothetical protein ACFL27_26015 [candidate division CSSED10-310 bacterium]|uniref:DUF4124 domain-containing protein n=1 Tax=candidate division CSSED10-310 bacterium TaxID=2855610 RepID=A0ABV6Z5E9_UNCC1
MVTLKKIYILIVLLLISCSFPTMALAKSYLWQDAQGKVHVSTNKPVWWDDCCLILVTGKRNIVDEIKTTENVKNFREGKDYIKSEKQDTSQRMYVGISDETTQNDEQNDQQQPDFQNHGQRDTLSQDTGKTQDTVVELDPQEVLEKIKREKAAAKKRQGTQHNISNTEKIDHSEDGSKTSRKPTARELEIYQASQKDLFEDHPDDPEEVSNKRIAKRYRISVGELKKINAKVTAFKRQQ